MAASHGANSGTSHNLATDVSAQPAIGLCVSAWDAERYVISSSIGLTAGPASLDQLKRQGVYA